MVMKFTNNAVTTLASGITNVATSLTVAGGAGVLFPVLGGGDYFYCTLTNAGGTIEIVKVTARATDTFTITRAQDNTTAVAWSTGDKCELRLVAASLNDIPKLDEPNVFTQPQTVGTGVNAGHAATVGQIQAQTGWYYQTAGTSTAYTLTPTPAITSYVAGQSFYVLFNAASGAAPTLQISGISTPPNLVRQLADGTFQNIAANEIPNNHRSRVTLLSASQALVEIPLPGSELNAATAKTTLATADTIPLSDSAASPAGQLKKITWANVLANTDTMTNKRITARVGSTASSATPTINTDSFDVYKLTAQTVDITSMTTNLSGTPTDNQCMIIEITGTAARAITWGTSFEASTVSLPSTTVGTNMLAVGFLWNTATSKWRCVAAV